jgi:hypothetical protein
MENASIAWEDDLTSKTATSMYSMSLIRIFGMVIGYGLLVIEAGVLVIGE